MKKILLYIGFVATVMGATGCKKDFLEDMRDWTGVNEDTYKSVELANLNVGYVYRLFQTPSGTNPFTRYQTGENGTYSDQYFRSTDEQAGQTDFNRLWPTVNINDNMANKYFGQKMSSSIANNVWTRMRQINLFLQEIDKHGLTPEQTAPLKGQMLFWRAYQYFELVKLYGGVPIVLDAQNPITVGNDVNLAIPRSKSSEVIAQIVKDLDLAITYLPGRWTNPGENWGRITSGAAAALKGRVLLTWASPLFNRTDDQSRWQAAYDANLAAKTLLETNNFGLFNTGGTANGTAWGNMFIRNGENPEGVFVTVFNTVTAANLARNNPHENESRPREIAGTGSISPTKQVVDAFPMKDGKAIDDPSSLYAYNTNKFYKNRDPRFYKTFAYNGALWPYGGNANYRIWTYQWYNNPSGTNPLGNPAKTTEALGANASGIYLAKATNPAATNANFAISGTDYMEIRFAEVVLNLAEAAIGSNKFDEGLAGIKQIRERAGVENADGDFGLSAARGNRDKLFGAIINERKVEFAYENKRFWDLRRWMLFNDDFGTCTRLGQKPIDGTRRTGFWVTVRRNGTPYQVASNYNQDPFLPKADGSFDIANRAPAGLSVAQMDAHVDFLYDNYFHVIERDNLDPTNPADWKFKWFNQYYFFGFHRNIFEGSPYLQQTTGWPDFYGAAGTFDPLQ